MIKHHLLITYRNFLRSKSSFFINIIGLSTGLACSIFIMLWVTDELSYDRFHTNAEKIYRITASFNDIKVAIVPAPMAAAVRSEIPEVVNSVRLSVSANLFQAGDRKFEEERVLFADPSFFEVFSFPLLKGNPKTALETPNSIIITEEMARKYFGQEEALGKIIKKDNQDNFIVTGILANIPSNSHLRFDFLMPMTFLARTNYNLSNNVWGNLEFYTYLLFTEKNVSVPKLQRINQQIIAINKKHDPTVKLDFKLQAMTEIHLHSKLMGDFPGNGDIQFVHVFLIVAIFILIVACINFMNLATARSARRAREVGLRKVLGAKRIQLIVQFMSESLIITFLALLIAIVIVSTCLPAFNELTNKKLDIHFSDPAVILKLLTIAGSTGVLSGIYPALFLSGFKPVNILKGIVKTGGGNVLFRNGLVVSQFTISIMLLVATLVVYNQLHYISNKNLGYKKENLLYTSLNGSLWFQQQTLKSQLKENTLTSDYSIVGQLPSNILSGTIGIDWEGKDPHFQIEFAQVGVDENFIDVFKIQLLNGRGFSQDFKGDSSNYILNEKAIQAMGMNVTTAVGKSFTLWGNKGMIIGIVKDFNFKSVQQPITPMILHMNVPFITRKEKIIIRTKPENTAATIQALERITSKLNPAFPFSYGFIDQSLADLYQNEQRIGKLFNLFALLAIFISCLGLYGLSAFTTEQRTKEIGVRKVLGASVSTIVYMLLTNFTKLILIALIISIPCSWVIMNRWLDDFAYHISIDWSVFLIAGTIAILIAWLTVGYESLKAAFAKPAKSLKTE